MSNELPVIEAKERNEVLTKLAGEISDLYLSALHKAKRSRETADDAVNDARLCGQKLGQVRDSMPHGKWQKWLGESCPEISYETATRYIRLSKLSLVTDLGGVQNLKQAYIACGILPQPPTVTGKPDEPIDFLDLMRFAGFAAKLTVENFNAVPLAEDQKEKLRDRLKPAHDAYLALL